MTKVGCSSPALCLESAQLCMMLSARGGFS